MKKFKTRSICIILALIFILNMTACNQSKLDSEQSESSSQTATNLSAELKDKYASDQAYTYIQSKENVAQDEILHLTLGINPEELGLEDLSQFAEVYTDKNLEYPLDVEVEYDAENSELLINPPRFAVFSPNDEKDSWGYSNIYYLTYYYDLDTGEKFEKPIVMPFTIENSIESPCLSFEKASNGFASFSWSEVDGAEKYHLYAFSNPTGLIWDVAEDLTETEYTEEFIDYLGSYTMTNTFYYESDDMDSTYQYFYVVAEKDGKISQASNLIDVDTFRQTLPYFIDTSSSTTLAAMIPQSISELSAYVDILMCDGKTVVRYPVTYHVEDREVVRIGDYISSLDEEKAEIPAMYFTFTVDGTAMTGFTLVQQYDYDEFDQELEAVLAYNEGIKGNATADNSIDVTRTDEDSSSESSAPPDNPTEEAENLTVTATSALSEYLATYMLNGEEIIDISDFPEARNTDVLVDAFFEAVYQNPLVLSVNSIAISNDGSFILVSYGQTKEELALKQSELLEEVKRIISEIITEDMTDLDKEVAINNYLCEVAEYDYDALENAMANDMQVDASFNDSFTPYGVLINNVGVCASYAGAFKLLADEAGLDCIVVTGYLNGNLAHAWNRVNIDGEWMSIDATNNDNPYLYNYLFNLPDRISATILVEDPDYIMDDMIEQYTGTSEDLEYYHISGQYYSKDEISNAIVEGLVSSDSVTLRTDYEVTESEVTEIMTVALSDSRLSQERLAELSNHIYYSDLGAISILPAA